MLATAPTPAPSGVSGRDVALVAGGAAAAGVAVVAANHLTRQDTQTNIPDAGQSSKPGPPTDEPGDDSAEK